MRQLAVSVMNAVPYAFVLTFLAACVFGLLMAVAPKTHGQECDFPRIPPANITPKDAKQIPPRVALNKYLVADGLDPLQSAQKYKLDSVYDYEWDQACEAWVTKNHNGRGWFETKDYSGLNHYLAERGPDGHWRLTKTNPVKAGIKESPVTKEREEYTPPALDTRSSINFGIVPNELSKTPNYSINGRPTNRDTVQAVLKDSADKINDISSKNWLVIVGTLEQQKRALDQITPAMSKELNVKTLTPDEVKAKGLAHESSPNDVTVYATTPDGEVKHKQTGTDGLQSAIVAGGLLGPRYDPKKDPDLRVKVDHQIPFLDNLKLDGKFGYILSAIGGAVLAWFFGRQNPPAAGGQVVVMPNPPAPAAVAVPSAVPQVATVGS